MRSGIVLSISKTSKEWDKIDEKLNGKKLNVYLRNKVNELLKAYEECPDCISCAGGKIKERRPAIHRKQYEQIEKIAQKMKIHPSKVIDRLIIAPMLLPN